MLKDITIGQYFPGNSLIHRLDPRMKIVLTLAYIVAALYRPRTRSGSRSGGAFLVLVYGDLQNPARR